MPDKFRITIAAAVTVLFLAATSAAGLLSHSLSHQTTAAGPSAPAKAAVSTPWHQEND